MSEFSEPWRHERPPEKGNWGDVFDCDGNRILQTEFTPDGSYIDRIVACINFCEGIDIETLERITADRNAVSYFRCIIKKHEIEFALADRIKQLENQGA